MSGPHCPPDPGSAPPSTVTARPVVVVVKNNQVQFNLTAPAREILRADDTDTILDIAQGYGEAGLNHLVIGFESHDLNQSLEHIERFATEVMPLCT